MEIKIYVDVLFVTNLLFNYLLLWLTGLLLRQHANTLRLLFVTLLGALYAVWAFFLPNLPLYTNIGKLIIGAVMTIIAYRPHCLRVCLKYICVFYAAVFILGGAAFCLFWFIRPSEQVGTIYRNGTLYMNLPIYLLLLLTALCYGILKVAMSVGAKISVSGKEIIPIHVVYHGRTVCLRGFYDSGNRLQAANGRGIIIVQKSVIKPLFKKEELVQTEVFTTLNYHTLQGEGQLKAFLPDAIYYKRGHHAIPIHPVYIALVDEPLNYYNNWDAILPHDFEGVEHHEPTIDAKAVQVFKKHGPICF
ncbi:MAG: hypothetical protein E7393_01880 [Ruminococcaceae bacterium]|nr:hypothetical protein [Oscillospiraceae bacterium]